MPRAPKTPSQPLCSAADTQLADRLTEEDAYSELTLPSQWYAHSVNDSPSRALMRAVLTRALEDFVKGDRHARSAEEWIFGPSNLGFIYSFETICDTLGLDAERLRSALSARRELAIAA